MCARWRDRQPIRERFVCVLTVGFLVFEYIHIFVNIYRIWRLVKALVEVKAFSFGNFNALVTCPTPICLNWRLQSLQSRTQKNIVISSNHMKASYTYTFFVKALVTANAILCQFKWRKHFFNLIYSFFEITRLTLIPLSTNFWLLEKLLVVLFFLVKALVTAIAF